METERKFSKDDWTTATAGARPGQWKKDVSSRGHGEYRQRPSRYLIGRLLDRVNKGLHDQGTSMDRESR